MAGYRSVEPSMAGFITEKLDSASAWEEKGDEGLACGVFEFDLEMVREL